MKLSIVVPCYNEAKNIPLILERFSLALADKNNVEVILVNNNSKDDTTEVLNKLLPDYPFARQVFQGQPGYGSAILAGLQVATGEFIGWTHGDLQTSPEDVVKVLDLIEQKKNESKIFYKGKRKGRAWVDVFFTWGMGIFESLYLRSWLFDINAQPNIFSKSFFEVWKNPPTDFSLDLYAFYLAKKMGFKVCRFSVLFPPRLHGESSWNNGWQSRLKFIKRTLNLALN